MSSGITETTAGVELDKHYEDEEYDLPSVVYEFVSRLSETVEIQLEETIPAELDAEHVGFHANYGNEHWRVQDGKLLFEYELGPKAEYTTVIAVGRGADYDAEKLVTTPETFEIEPLENPGVGSPPSGSVTRSTSTDEDRSGGDTEPSPGDEDDRDTSALDRGTHTPDDEPSEAPDSEASGNDSLAEGDSVGEELAAELEAGTLSERAVRTLRRGLQLERPVPGSVDARIDQLQSEVSELEAYTSALEAFLDEHGTAEEIIGQFEEELESFEDELQSLETRTDAQDREIASLRTDGEKREREYESLSAEMSSVHDDVEALSSAIARLRDELPEGDVDGRLATVEDEVAEVSDIITRLDEAFE